MSDLENRFSNQVNLETYQAPVENLALLLNILAEYALENGWHKIESSKSSHAYCRLRCYFGHSEHHMSVWSTPRSPENHAKQILRKVDERKGAE